MIGNQPGLIDYRLASPHDMLILGHVLVCQVGGTEVVVGSPNQVLSGLQTQESRQCLVGHDELSLGVLGIEIRIGQALEELMEITGALQLTGELPLHARKFAHAHIIPKEAAIMQDSPPWHCYTESPSGVLSLAPPSGRIGRMVPVPPPTPPAQEISHEETQPDTTDRLDCIKTRERAHADVFALPRMNAGPRFVNIVREVGLVGKRLKWDPVAERFTNCEEANQNRWMTRPRRNGYELPG